MKVPDRPFPHRRAARRRSRWPRGRPEADLGVWTRGAAWNPGMRPSAPVNPGTPLAARPMQVLRGIAISPGIALAPVVVRDPRGLRLPPRSIAAGAVAAEWERLDRGLEAARDEAGRHGAEAGTRLGPQYADILTAHSRMIADPTLRRDARRLIEQEQIRAEHAVAEVLEGYAARLEQLAGSHLAARAADVRDIQGRILSHLLGERPEMVAEDLTAPTIVLAHDLTPREAAGLDPQRVPAFAT